jgi:hypothetical protein
MEIARLKTQGSFAIAVSALTFVFATILLFVPFGEFGSVLSPADYDGNVYNLIGSMNWLGERREELEARTFWVVFLYILFALALIFALNRFGSANRFAANDSENLVDPGQFAQIKSASGEFRSCPFCAEPIRSAAVYCKHCKRDVK